MKKNVCDICQREVGEYKLYDIHTEYREQGLEHICKDCNDTLAKIKFRTEEAIRNATREVKRNWIKRIIQGMRKSKP